MDSIQYIKGDATQPIGDGIKIIVHCCNDVGAWGKGFVKAISDRFPLAEQEYREWFRLNPQPEDEFGRINSDYPKWELGSVQYINVEENIIIANMIGQHGILIKDPTNPPIRYNAIRKGLYNVREYICECIDSVYGFEAQNASIHMPRVGCGLAGGNWDKIEEIILDVFYNTNVPIYVYDFEDRSSKSYIKYNK